MPQRLIQRLTGKGGQQAAEIPGLSGRETKRLGLAQKMESQLGTELKTGKNETRFDGGRTSDETAEQITKGRQRVERTGRDLQVPLAGAARKHNIGGMGKGGGATDSMVRQADDVAYPPDQGLATETKLPMPHAGSFADDAALQEAAVGERTAVHRYANTGESTGAMRRKAMGPMEHDMAGIEDAGLAVGPEFEQELNRRSLAPREELARTLLDKPGVRGAAAEYDQANTLEALLGHKPQAMPPGEHHMTAGSRGRSTPRLTGEPPITSPGAGERAPTEPIDLGFDAPRGQEPAPIIGRGDGDPGRVNGVMRREQVRARPQAGGDWEQGAFQETIDGGRVPFRHGGQAPVEAAPLDEILQRLQRGPGEQAPGQRQIFRGGMEPAATPEASSMFTPAERPAPRMPAPQIEAEDTMAEGLMSAIPKRSGTIRQDLRSAPREGAIPGDDEHTWRRVGGSDPRTDQLDQILAQLLAEAR